ncbi:MAG: hypothetical protein WCY48_11030, partial [Candidatus Caldatribacteriota bacterium]
LPTKKKRNIFDISTRRSVSEVPQSVVRSHHKEQLCSCVESNFMIKMGDKAEEAEKIIEDRANELSDEILKSFGKKFINEYAHHYEDGMYFLNHTDLIPQRQSEELLCRGAKRFEKAVAKRCPDKDKNILRERMNLILSEMDFGEAKTLEDKLKHVDVNTVQRKAKDSQGNEFTYLRTEYDKTRYGLKTADHFKSMDKILTTVLTQGDLDPIKDRYPFKNGVELISIYLSDLLIRDFDGATQTLLKDVPENVIKEWREIRNGPNPRGALETRFLKFHFRVIPSNPVLGSVLLDNILFSRFYSSVKNKKVKSVFDELEKNFSEMRKYMESRCRELEDNFAEVVCLEKEEVIGSLTDKDILNFVGDTIDEYDPLNGVNDILACRANSKPLLAFKDLNREGSKLLNSDYFGLIQNKDNPTDPYSTLAHTVANDPVGRNLMQAAAKVSEDGPKRKSSYNPLLAHFENLKSDRFIDSSGTILEVKNPEVFSTSAQIKEIKELKKVEVGEEISHSSTSSSGELFELVTHQMSTPVQPIPNFRVTHNDSSEIVDFLSNREDKEVINRHVSHLDTQQINDLNNFRTSILKEKEDLLNLKLDEEKKNLEKLKTQIDSLTSSKAMMEDIASNPKTEQPNTARVAASQDVKERVVSNSDLNERNLPGRLEGRNYSAPTSVVAPIAGSVPQMGGAASVAGGGTSVSSGASRSIASIPSASLEKKEGSTSSRGLIVSAKTPISDNKKEITKNIVEYLKSADTETLLQFTTEGVIYQYQTLENGVLIEKEIHVSLDDVDPEMLAEIIKESELKIEQLQRKYSYETLKIIISEEALKL